jgi:two-component system chemotaxis response regulator CheB
MASAIEPERPQAGLRFVAIGASGSEGLNDIKAVLRELPATLNAAVLVVLHRPTDRISYLRDVLARSSNMPIVIAEEGERFEARICYVGEPGGHLTLAAKSRAHLVEDTGTSFRGRTVDALFGSLADLAGDQTIGVVLSGSLDDGSQGLAAIKKAGGLTMVLKTAGRSSVGMPDNAIAYDGPIDTIGNAQVIGRAIEDAVQHWDAHRP